MPGGDAHNPMGTDGFEFVEFAAPDPDALGRLFARLGFACRARHRSKQAWLWRQGDIHFIVNAEPGSFGERFARLHGPSICALAFRVRDAAAAYGRALELGAWGIESRAGPMELNIPAIKGVGDSLIYLVDRYGERGTIYDVDFEPLSPPPEPGVGLTAVDHLTHNLHRGRLAEWAEFYARLFGFREIRRFDIRGQHTGLHSQALCSPCGKIRIPLNEASDERSQVQEYLDAYRGEGIQHVALASDDIFASVEALRARGVEFLSTPATYYEALAERLPKHGEDAARLQRLGILLDGDPERGEGLLLQIFSEPLVGPIFFELIQRKGNQGFGEGNFQALFEAMELDQIRRGVLRP
jgi:4-hydroxyphenylpyruvate dioxygenase